MKIRKLVPYLKPYWRTAILAPLLMILEVVMDLAQPALMQKMVDIGIAGKNLNYVFKTAPLMFLFALVGLAGGFGCTVFSTIAAQNFGADLRKDLFVKVQNLSCGNIERLKPGQLITRLTNDVMQLQNMVMMMLRILVRAPLLIIGSFVMAVVTCPDLVPILLIVIPVLIGILYFVIKKSYPLFSQVQEDLDGVNTVMQENLAGIRVVKAFVRSDYEKKKFAVVNEKLMKSTMRAARTVALALPAIMLTVNAGTAATLWFGGLKVQYGGIKVGQIMAFINYLTQLLTSLMMVGMILVNLSRAGASASRIIEVLESNPDIKDRPEAIEDFKIKGAVTFENVTFSYAGSGREPVLKDISFSVKAGETVGILGTTGSGKSTLVQLIPRLYEVTRGRILIDGVDIRKIELETLRKQIGIVFQQSILFSGSIKDNIRYGKEDATDEEVKKAVKTAQASEFVEKFPAAYNTVLSQRGVNLSGGQKQRLCIARALVRKPAILILDDSTSAVDAKSESLIQKALKEKIRECTCFIVAQKVTSVMDADKILVLDEGRIVALGTHEELLKNSEIYRDICSSQLGEEVNYA